MKTNDGADIVRGRIYYYVDTRATMPSVWKVKCEAVHRKNRQNYVSFNCAQFYIITRKGIRGSLSTVGADKARTFIFKSFDKAKAKAIKEGTNTLEGVENALHTLTIFTRNDCLEWPRS